MATITKSPDSATIRPKPARAVGLGEKRLEPPPIKKSRVDAVEIAVDEADVKRTIGSLRGRVVVVDAGQRPPLRGATRIKWFGKEHNDLAMHETIVNGVEVVKLIKFMRDHKSFTADDLAPALRVSTRTLSRLAEGKSTTLSVSQGEGLVGLLQSVQLGAEVFGSESAALEWFKKPAIGLEGRRPIDLLSTSFGTKLVLDLLTRIQYGVYS